jgi:hypothetical protein
MPTGDSEIATLRREVERLRGAMASAIDALPDGAYADESRRWLRNGLEAPGAPTPLFDVAKGPALPGITSSGNPDEPEPETRRVLCSGCGAVSSSPEADGWEPWLWTEGMRAFTEAMLGTDDPSLYAVVCPACAEAWYAVLEAEA